MRGNQSLMRGLKYCRLIIVNTVVLYTFPNENQVNPLFELWNYYQNMYNETSDHIISAFKTKLFAGPLQTIVAIVTNEVQSKFKTFWNFFDKSICLPEVYKQ